MISILYIFLFTICVTNALPILEKPNERFMWISDDNGTPHYVDLWEEPSSLLRFDPEEDVRYLLYTRANAGDDDYQVIKKGDIESLLASNFDVRKPLKVTVAGWNSDYLSLSNTLPRAAFLNASDVNVISVDWQKGSQTGYSDAVRNCIFAGLSAAEFVDWINDVGVSFDDMHFVGNSLGAHVVGIMGRFSRGTVDYITAMDPANPSWGPNSMRVRKTDGKYLEVIHSNAGILGIRDPIGHNDFYPNQGLNMPGCDMDVFCSHELARHYIAESIVSGGFTSVQCMTLNEAVAGVDFCTGNETLQMGGMDIKPEIGIFALNTNDRSPFSLS